jgi:tRNA dimethylallyltransferase
MRDADHPLIVVAGPTASGKTALAIHLAEQLNGEIVSCDSVAVYRLMEIGTATPSAAARAGVPHHCLDLYWPNEACTAGDYARHARTAIAGIRERGRIPIVAGGTGLYLRALLEGLAPSPPRDEALREELRARAAAEGSAALHAQLQELDPRAAALIHANDVPKLIRSIEVSLAAGRPQTEQWQAERDPLLGYRITQIGLTPPRAALYQRIDARCRAMFDQGLVAETAMLRAQFGDDCRALTSLGYAQAMSVLRGELTLHAALSSAQQGHRNYAKRQLTWFRRSTSIHWLQSFGNDPTTQSAALAACSTAKAL